MAMIYDYRINIKTAGPSEYGVRSEIYFSGCQRALDGNPCPGCFNRDLWSFKNGTYLTPEQVIDRLEDQNSVKAVTIVGGEPGDQPYELYLLVKELKKHGYHIALFTHKEYSNYIEDANIRAALMYVDVLIDGSYDPDQRHYDDTHENQLLCFIGSKNQRVYDLRQFPVVRYYRYPEDLEEISEVMCSGK